jgi:hypothetical protein
VYNPYFEDVTLAVDTNLYKFSKNVVQPQKRNALYFEYTSRYAVCEVRFYPKKDIGIQKLDFVTSAGYEVLDSIAFVNNECYRGRIRFADLYNNKQLSLLVNVVFQKDGILQRATWELALFPYTQTWVKFFPGNDFLFVGEEKIFDLETNNADNIKVTGDWQTSNGIDYRLAAQKGRLQLHVLPRVLGVKELNIQLETLSPYLDANKMLTYNVSIPAQPLTIKASRLVFLNMDRKEVTYDDEARSKGVIVTIDNNRRLQMKKTYRIENQEGAGGSLVAELFTIKDLTNDKVLCKFTVFNMHRKTKGYLYLKDGDSPQFITNLDITPQMQISRVSVLHEGEDWRQSVQVRPGETVDVSVEGEALHKAHFHWQDVQDVTSDTLVQTENRRLFKLVIPMDINKRRIDLLNNGQPTKTFLLVEEYQHPRPFDFITLNYGYGSHTQVNKISNTIISRSVIKDFTLSFNESGIDSKTKMYGKQYLDIDVRLLGKRGEIIEMRTLKNQLVCPDETSPRGAYYKDKNCLSEDINLNNILGTKTSALDNFGKVQVDVKQSADKYSEPVFEHRIEVIYQPKVMFDIDLSLPAGMMIQNLGESKTDKSSFTDNLGGISIALIAQFSFTDSEKAGKLRPYRCGAGFLFINTFNFSESAQRDLAIVALGSIYPLSSRRMFNVPIHAGFGYKLQGKVPFVMISPGISVTF